MASPSSQTASGRRNTYGLGQQGQLKVPPESLVTLSRIPAPCLTSVISQRPETLPTQPSNGTSQVDRTRNVKEHTVLDFPRSGQAPMCCKGVSIFLPAPTCQRTTFASSSVRDGETPRSSEPYKFTMKKIINGLPSIESNIMALPSRQRMHIGATTLPFAC